MSELQKVNKDHGVQLKPVPLAVLFLLPSLPSSTTVVFLDVPGFDLLANMTGLLRDFRPDTEEALEVAENRRAFSNAFG